MDTITQALLGGAIGFTVAKESRRKAMLWGAGIAILPDLDVFIPYNNDLDSMTFHRSWSHSWFVQTAIAPLLSLVLYKVDKQFNFQTWLKIVWLALVTHSGLDALTVYGTQLFWPLLPPPVSGGSVFIIDPLYSIPLLTSFLLVLTKPRWKCSQSLMKSSFVFSCLYLAWGFTVQQFLINETRQQLALQGVEYDKVNVMATAFNTLLWRVLVMHDDYYLEGYRSVLDNNKTIAFTRYDRKASLLATTQHIAAIEKIAWFTNGFFKVEIVDDLLIASDLRMGMEPNYFFRFKIAELQNGQVGKNLLPNRFHTEQNRQAHVNWVWQRILHPQS